MTVLKQNALIISIEVILLKTHTAPGRVMSCQTFHLYYSFATKYRKSDVVPKKKKRYRNLIHTDYHKYYTVAWNKETWVNVIYRAVVYAEITCKINDLEGKYCGRIRANIADESVRISQTNPCITSKRYLSKLFTALHA